MWKASKDSAAPNLKQVFNMFKNVFKGGAVSDRHAQSKPTFSAQTVLKIGDSAHSAQFHV